MNSKESINCDFLFSGIGIECGQKVRGLSRSAHFARNYFNDLLSYGIKVADTGDINCKIKAGSMTINNKHDLSKIKSNIFDKAYHKTLELLSSQIPVVNWGGDHSISIATISAFLNTYPEGYVIWVDAHGDINTPENSKSGNIHGMPLSFLTRAVKKQFSWMSEMLSLERLIYIGIRDLDCYEEELICRKNIKLFKMRDINEGYFPMMLDEVVEKIQDNPVHISFDIDSVDPIWAPSTGTSIAAGMSLEDLYDLGTFAQHYLNLKSIDIVEINPFIGSKLDVQMTYHTAFHFLLSLFSNQYHGADYEHRVNEFRIDYRSKNESQAVC